MSWHQTTIILTIFGVTMWINAQIARVRRELLEKISESLKSSEPKE
jgi:hypothetical protein